MFFAVEQYLVSSFTKSTHKFNFLVSEPCKPVHLYVWYASLYSGWPCLTSFRISDGAWFTSKQAQSFKRPTKIAILLPSRVEDLALLGTNAYVHVIFFFFGKAGVYKLSPKQTRKLTLNSNSCTLFHERYKHGKLYWYNQDCTLGMTYLRFQQQLVALGKRTGSLSLLKIQQQKKPEV